MVAINCRYFEFESDRCRYLCVVLLYPFLHCILLNCSSLHGLWLSLDLNELAGHFLWSDILSDQITKCPNGTGNCPENVQCPNVISSTVYCCRGWIIAMKIGGELIMQWKLTEVRGHLG